MPLQCRWICHDCHREWVYWRAWRDGQNCPACGSSAIEQIRFEGLFDHDTPPDATAAVLVQADEDTRRMKLVGRVEISDPPPVLAHSEEEHVTSIFE